MKASRDNQPGGKDWTPARERLLLLTLATIQFTQIRAYFRFTRHPPARTPGRLLTGNLDLPAELRSSSFDRTQLNIRLDTLTNG